MSIYDDGVLEAYYGPDWVAGYKAGETGLGLSACDHPPGSEEQKKFARGWSDGRLHFIGGYTGPKNGELMPGLDAPVVDPCAILELEPDHGGKRPWKAEVRDPIDEILNPKEEPTERAFDISYASVRGWAVGGIVSNVIYHANWTWPAVTAVSYQLHDDPYALNLGNLSASYASVSYPMANSLKLLLEERTPIPTQRPATKKEIDQEEMKDHVQKERRRLRNRK